MFLAAILCNIVPKAQASVIKNYSVYYASADYNGRRVLILRQFEDNHRLSYLAVDPASLKTEVVPGDRVIVNPLGWPKTLLTFKETPYMKAIRAAQSQSSVMQDAGVTRGYAKERGVSLTIDLCPSHKPLDRVIFTSLINEFKKTERPVPVGLSVTGKFMQNHGKDIDWLKGLVKSGDISITWVNHTFNHRYKRNLPLQVNFLLEPGTNISDEILNTEIAMLDHGLLPSVFFRFPGLVSDKQVVSQVLSFGLIPVGSDAWLAKGQRPREGSIVLIHGNGNEPAGVKQFMTMLERQKPLVGEKRWFMYDLSESVGQEFK